jgi:hypothetical protein
MIKDHVTAQAVRQRFTDDTVVNINDLALAMRVSRWTVGLWRKQGYQFEFGRRTTPGRLKAWLRAEAASQVALPNFEANRLEAALTRLR